MAKFGPIGSIVDIRTYRRWVSELQRRERLEERNQRATDYNCDLAKDLDPDIERDRELMREYMDKFLAFPSGRSMWVGGTSVTEKHPAGCFNCSALAINRLNAFATVFELLMLGTGVGYRVFTKDIEQLPKIKVVPDIEFQPYSSLKKAHRIEETIVSEFDGESLVMVGDSRQGWIDAVDYLIQSCFKGQVRSIVFNVDSIRPMGERIYGFGGTASGPDALKGIIKDVHRVFEECPDSKLRSIDCMDICDAIAKGVVAGSSRRSALICLFEEGDDLCANAKRGLFSDPGLAHKQYRIQSNNTECIGVSHLPKLRAFLESNPDASWDEINKFIDQYKPSVEWLRKRFEVVRYEGEPGFNNFLLMTARRWKAVREWRPGCPIDEIWVRYCDVCTNPCHEILLSAGYSKELKNCGKGVSFCNLTTLPLQNFVKDGGVDWELLEKAIKSTVRIGLRQTCVKMPRPELHDTQIEERLLGVSATGWRMLFDIIGWKTASEDVKLLQTRMNQWANEEATRYAEVLGVPRPLLVTCIKPEGTGSKVFGSTDGLHWDWAPYYIRRIQMATTDALARTLKKQGFVWNPKDYDLNRLIEPGNQDLTVWDRLDRFNQMTEDEKDDIFFRSNAVTFDFPIKSPASVSSGQVSAIEQLENVKSFTMNYTDHMPSSTITVKDDEWDSIAEWINENWSSYITASMFSYYNGSYPLLPYEDITEEEYYQMVAKFDPRYIEWNNGIASFVVDEDLMAQEEREDLEEGIDIDEVDLNPSCSTGACPVR
jgi:adenosylcobalamin-dependent ribonucleoside-triphosphate reductase